MAQSLWSALGVPPVRIPIDGPTFVSYILPLLVCYFTAAVLVITPRTHTLRLALWPLFASLALRAVLYVDLSPGQSKGTSIDLSFAYFLFYAVSRTLDWALAKEPLVRCVRPLNSSPSTILDALDLVSNARGLGWEWSRGLHVPRKTRPATRMPFLFYTLLSAIAHASVCGALHRAVLTMASTSIGLQQRLTIFDDTLPFLMRYLRASILSILTGFTIYASTQMSYDIMTILGILLGQDPAQWPPAFDAPWRATSLADFWGRRWHQLMRRTFLAMGGYPLSLVLGRPGVIMGAFLVSAALHHTGLMALDSEMKFWWMLGAFGMMGPGILAERVFSHWTGRRVGGMAGWLWTMTWLVLWGNVMVEAFVRAGMLNCVEFISWLPRWTLVERLAAIFDTWLHVL